MATRTTAGRLWRAALLEAIHLLSRPLVRSVADDPSHQVFRFFVEETQRYGGRAVLELGARNSTIRRIVPASMQYVGFDIRPGPNVDVVGDIHELSRHLEPEAFDFGCAVEASTANRELSRLKHALGRAVACGYLKANPAGPVKKVKEPPGRTRYLSPEERAILLEGRDVTVKATDGRAWTVRRAPSDVLRAYMVAALQTGARRSELVRLTQAGMDTRARTVTFRHTKNGDARTVPMTETLRAVLQGLPRSLDPNAPVFPERDPKVLSRMFARYVRTVGLPNLTFHDLRHDAASTLTMAGVPQRTVMAVLGAQGPAHDDTLPAPQPRAPPGRDAGPRGAGRGTRRGGAKPGSIGTI